MVGLALGRGVVSLALEASGWPWFGKVSGGPGLGTQVVTDNEEYFSNSAPNPPICLQARERGQSLIMGTWLEIVFASKNVCILIRELN